MDRGIGDTQLSGYLCDRLATGLRQLHRLLFEFSRIDFLNLCHADPFPNLLEYISALGTLPNRGKVILSATFSIVLLAVAVVILVQAIDGVGLLFEAGAREEGSKRIVALLVGVVLMLLCGALVWLLILRLHQSLGDFLLGSDAVLMQVEILVVGALAWREARRRRLQQQQKP